MHVAGLPERPRLRRGPRAAPAPGSRRGCRKLERIGRAPYRPGVRIRALMVPVLLGAAATAHAQEPPTEPTGPARALLEAGGESPELRALRAFEERTFGRMAAPDEGPFTSTRDVTFLAGAELPDLPARFDDAVVEYLIFFRDDPRGRELMRAWYRRGNRYDATLRAALREAAAPEDLRCVALAESGFDPRARSPVGALGMFQFMEPTAREYGLARDLYVDERMDVERSTRAAARYLTHLRRRFGTWELALAAYNMGYGALLRAIRKYNTNDYALLARTEAALPFETTTYVAKILACGVVLRNPDRFGLGDVVRDPPDEVARVEVPGGLSLGEAATLAGVPEAQLVALNPQLLRGIAPPRFVRYPLRVPTASASRLTAGLATNPPTFALGRARFGETLAGFARRAGTDEATLRTLNRLEPTETLPFPATLIVPRPLPDPRPPTRSETRPVVAVVDAGPPAAGRRRVYYPIADGDELDRIATFFGVEVDELARTNALDPRARLQPGMILRVDADATTPFEDAIVLAESEVDVLVTGSDAFFDYQERLRGRVRVAVRVETGDTLGGIAARYGLTVGDLARINRIPRTALLRVGQTLLVYTSPDLAAHAGASR